MRVKDKVALITGSSRGIGKQVALKLAREGAKIVVNYPLEAEAENAQQVVAEIEKLGAKATAIKADVTNLKEVKSMVKQTKKEYGSLDILVNNAGITKDTLLMRMKEKDWDAVLDVNLKGAFNATKAVSRLMMKQRSGRIINVSSVVGLMGNAGQANYSASKAGLIGLTKSTARELAKRGITVNAVAPGFIETAMTDELSDKVVKKMTDEIPMQEFGQPEDIADTILFLASDEARYITGEVIRIDGGMAM
ncbi:3-oxoacyl-(acyl-carrier-protein) reductase [Halobacteroides halobius DSM 5150]|uniref:3-oxoacyl-[acyl-carrier-protein] reductase n=1 Tax=Halobacteroides halobius (strain ATCC 35273 / DSM 5150 / MD-1) TaxID=748449 RepID=L0KBA8_HALHC|nr:3-oxoacyl-[acyl-carrier-protein] reductase [Halobacteroides halobius]AGB41363.1 3-oxoacyl-(acyl-carrier-protein) reductase [Halobacteroides halobius DSM 5150]